MWLCSGTCCVINPSAIRIADFHFHLLHTVFPAAYDHAVTQLLPALLREHGAQSIIEAAYRYVRHEPGASVVLFGTGDPSHVRSNIKAILKPPLPQTDLQHLAELFGKLEGVGLDLPARNPGNRGEQRE